MWTARLQRETSRGPGPPAGQFCARPAAPGGCEVRSVYFGAPETYDSGVVPRIAAANGTLVEVHESERRRALFYHVGTRTGGLVRFGPSRPMGNGMNPAVAVNAGGTVVEVHVTDSLGSHQMYYRVGQVQAADKTINFGQSLRYDTGYRPQVGLNANGAVVEVHETTNRFFPSRYWYRVGVVDPGSKTISFGGGKWYADGKTPTVAINNANVAIEFFRWRAQRGDHHLWYRVGAFDPRAKTITFGPRIYYEEGERPAVALTDDGFVIVVHQSYPHANLFSRIGKVNVATKAIDWVDRGSFLYLRLAWDPAVALDGATAVQVNMGQRQTLQCAASMLVDRSSWMADSLDLIGDRKLMEIAMPASHDAGMSTARNCAGPPTVGSCQTKTQNHDILGQLRFGCRYFDIRPVLHGGVMRTGHFSQMNIPGWNPNWGCNGQDLAAVLDNVKTYLQDGRDLVILKFSHYYDRDHGIVGRWGFTDDQMKRLLKEVTDALQPFLYDREVHVGGLQSVTVNEYIGKGGKVLAVFDKLKEDIKQQSKGVYSYADKGSPGADAADLIVYDSWTNTPDLELMVSDQLGKLADVRNHGANLFLLSWTLSQSGAQAVGCFTGLAPSVLELARQANGALWSRLVAAYERGGITASLMPNLIYTDDISGGQAEFVIWLNREILGGRR